MPAVELTQGEKAGRHGFVGIGTLGSLAHEHGAGSAVPFSATFLGTGQAEIPPYEVEGRSHSPARSLDDGVVDEEA
jgi:hypothetical protein